MFTTYRDQICNVLSECIKSGAPVVLYPFGERGRQVKEILNTEFETKEAYIVDNYYAGEIPVIRVGELADCLTDDMHLLLCCENKDVKRQIKDTLSFFPQSQIIDVFPEENNYLFDRQQADIALLTLNDLEQIYSELQKLAFDNDRTVYTTLDNYESDVLLQQFETFVVQNIKNKALQRAYSLLLYALLKKLWIDENEPLAGNAAYRRPNSTYPSGVYEEIYRLQKAEGICEEEAGLIKSAWDMRLFTRFPGGHVVPGYEKLLQKGIAAYLSELKEKSATAGRETEAFYRAEMISLRALQELIRRYAQLAGNGFPHNQKCGRIAQSCEYIAENRPRNFEQALQLLWLAHEMMIAEGDIKGISLGRMDQYLYPFYQEDLENGILDRERACNLICSLWKKFEFDRKALAFQNVTIGGGGNKKENPLTLMFLDAQMKTRANQPMLSLRVNASTSDAVWEKALALLSTGMGVPALFNDDVVVQAKQEAGVRKEDALDYSIVGCVEQTAGGKEYSHTEGLRLNTVKLLELMLFKGVCPITGGKYRLSRVYGLETFTDFETFYNWYKAELLYLLQNAGRLLEKADICYSENWPAPYLSLFMEGCFEKGKDVTAAGTQYCNLSINFAGMANVVNALISIKKVIFEKKMAPFPEITTILRNNFKGYEVIRDAAEAAPKYGSNNEEADGMMQELTELIITEMGKMRTAGGKKFQAGFYTVTLHAEMGKYLLATFDGRKQGAALASSLSPAQGTDTKGPLAVFHSIGRLPMNKMSNGMVLDMRFSPEFFKTAKKEKMKRAVLAYFSMGGMELQLNVVNQETLLEAQRHPQAYKSLLVRVSGFSTYFVELEKVIQDEIIARCMHRNL